MAEQKTSKMTRQLRLFHYIVYHEIYSPRDLMKLFGYGSHRTLQRDLDDLRDSGMANMIYNRKEDCYINKTGAVLDETSPARRLQHLKKLNRLCTIIRVFEPTEFEDEVNSYHDNRISEYEDLLEYYLECKKTPEGIKEYGVPFEPPERPDVPDFKAEYYKLFPESNERTRQRDFKELKEAGFVIEYHSLSKLYVIIDQMEPHEELIMSEE